MKLSLSASKLVQPRVNLALNLEGFFGRKDKVVFVMGATGTGKSRLAIDLATRFPAEIVNSDKMQVYKGLDILTNKVTEEECKGVPHHMLGIVDPDTNFTSMDFQHRASLAVESIHAEGRFPIVAGGSNSYIEALVNDDPEFRLRCECCFLWVDVSLPVLHSFVSERVDKMVQAGLVDEAAQIFDPMADCSKGIRRAIGVPELDQYFRGGSTVDAVTGAKMLETAISKIKENTCTLASLQLQKILRFYNRWRWRMHRIDATEVFLKRGDEADEKWERLVAGPSTMIVDQFLCEKSRVPTILPSATSSSVPIAAAVAAATR
ncbi:Adenylate isopentenyltransferase 5 [Hibiscus syriacus]|uniref:adenylate dimethylallyltransferase (ADP/ATP-dependent) n=1 Tax=Hibiscus syriacus TaxID=106335 RepID=A0A6A2ZXL5_HIBSY|nr:adenylate isopentenyltransferase 5, chloroplastic-like [Hibiscus syriacus]KAE8696316.1 Adenylate isopentenyltransferase 5 [Hibiscus syriacus]